MNNQISKYKILQFLYERQMERSKNTYDNESKYRYLNDGALSFINSILTQIENGKFDDLPIK